MHLPIDLHYPPEFCILNAQKFSKAAVSFSLLDKTHKLLHNSSQFLSMLGGICHRGRILQVSCNTHLSGVKQPGPQYLKKLSKHLGPEAGKWLVKLCFCALSFPHQDLEGRKVTAQHWGKWASCSRQSTSSQNPELPRTTVPLETTYCCSSGQWPQLPLGSGLYSDQACVQVFPTFSRSLVSSPVL